MNSTIKNKTKAVTFDETTLYLSKITVDQLPAATRRSPLVPFVLKLAKALPAGEGRELNQTTVKGGTWASVVRKMHKNEELGKEFNVERRGDSYYFVHREQAA